MLTVVVVVVVVVVVSPAQFQSFFIYILYIYNCTFCTIGGYEKETLHLLDYIYIKSKNSTHKNRPTITQYTDNTVENIFLHTMVLTVVLSSGGGGGGLYLQIVSEGRVVVGRTVVDWVITAPCTW